MTPGQASMHVKTAIILAIAAQPELLCECGEFRDGNGCKCAQKHQATQAATPHKHIEP